ncbi:mucin-16-like isoform X2 [Diceros bicornis minor]|uniref:mucin-16-like isoform X2 n=1 Tax=Diceros bicornis minor TaxID=77932 RepID=UPI0026EA39B0|nr:mucin-16-like isoform X2 [Diceros bicornis minor]
MAGPWPCLESLTSFLHLFNNSGTDVTVVSTTKFPVYESSSWLKSDPLTPMTVVDSVGYNCWYWMPTTNMISTFSPGSPASLTPTSISTAAAVGPALMLFTLSFIIANLLYTPDMRHPGSTKSSSTEKALNCLLGPFFKNTSVGPLYCGCRLTSLRL